MSTTSAITFHQSCAPDRLRGPAASAGTTAGPALRQTYAPEWVDRFVDAQTDAKPIDVDGLTGDMRCGRRFAHVSLCIPGAHDMRDYDLQRSVSRAYLHIHRVLRRGRAPHPIRFWNHIPQINHCVDGQLNRYMVFNAGRYAAYLRVHGSLRRFGHFIATATGVGHAGRDLHIACLADREPGRPVENPRQFAAYRYTHRYGPMPPCFARATVIASPNDTGGNTMLIGGTASVLGEATVHINDLDAQIEEAIFNIRALMGHVGDGRLIEVRAYYVRPADRQTIFTRLARWLPHLRDRVEMVLAPLCRSNLQVEIEGVAAIG